MKAVIMAGGEGTRLRPLTANMPKPMLPVANRPMLEHVIRLLVQHGFEEIVVTVAYLASVVQTYFGDGSDLGVRLVYARENVPLGTAGSVRNARDELTERFLVISGDVLTDIDLSALCAFHEEHKAVATLALKRMENPVDFGIVITRPDGSVERFLEKPTWGQVFSDTVNTGVYVLEPEIFEYMPDGGPVDFSSDVFPALQQAGGAVFGWEAGGYWEDVGTLEAYLRAHTHVLDGKVSVDIGGFAMRSRVWIGEGAEVDPSATVQAPALIGDNCRIGAEVHLGAHTVLGANVVVNERAALERTVVHDNVYIGTGASIRGSVIGRACDVRQNVRCEEGVVLADQCFVGADAVLGHGVKVFPNKTVESGALVNTSIVWETRAARNLFGRIGVSGVANVDVSPELAVRVAMAWASSLPKGATVVTSRDSSRAARMLKRALMVGLNAAGADVEDLEVATVPVTRFAVRSGSSHGGLTVRLSPVDPKAVVFRFFDAGGLDLDEGAQRRIERNYQREEFRRVLATEIGDISFPPRAAELYTAELMASVPQAAIRHAGFKVVLDYTYGTASFVMPNVLAKLGADVLVVNPYAATRRAMTVQRAENQQAVANLVRSSGAHLGAVIDADGEQLSLVDDRGRSLSDEHALLAFLHLACMARERHASLGEGAQEGGPPGADGVKDLASDLPAAFAVPVSASHAAEEIGRRAGMRIVRTKLSMSSLMEVAATREVCFAGSTWGGFILPDFLPGFDAAAAFVQLLAMLATTGERLSEVVDRLPAVRIGHVEVPTHWEAKGGVMRSFMEAVPKGAKVVLIDGVKVVQDGGWSLVLPDPERPVTHVWAEARDPGRSDDLAHRVAAQVEGLARAAGRR